MTNLNALNPNNGYLYITKDGDVEQTKDKGFFTYIGLLFSGNDYNLKHVASKLYDKLNVSETYKNADSLKEAMTSFQSRQADKSGKHAEVFNNCLNIWEVARTYSNPNSAKGIQTRTQKQGSSYKTKSVRKRNLAVAGGGKVQQNNKKGETHLFASSKSAEDKQQKNDKTTKKRRKKKAKATDAFARATGLVAGDNNRIIGELMTQFSISRKTVIEAVNQAHNTHDGNAMTASRRGGERSKTWVNMKKGETLILKTSIETILQSWRIRKLICPPSPWEERRRHLVSGVSFLSQ